jgi:tRNA threonylcarbamoyladenosine biosynthesis protein TsaE
MNASPEKQIILPDEAKTLLLGAKLAHLARPGDVIALYGNLGAGKTTLVRGMIHALLGEDTEVPSPTYTIVQTYDLAETSLWHFDLYRIEAPEELIELGFDEALDDVAVIEWPENAGHLLPQRRLSVTLAPSGTGRIAHLVSTSADWTERLNEHFPHD